MRFFAKSLLCVFLISQPLLSFAKTATPSKIGSPLAQAAPNSRAGHWVNAGLNEDTFLGIYQSFFKSCQISIQNLEACIAGVNTILARANPAQILITSNTPQNLLPFKNVVQDLGVVKIVKLETLPQVRNETQEAQVNRIRDHRRQIRELLFASANERLLRINFIQLLTESLRKISHLSRDAKTLLLVSALNASVEVLDARAHFEVKEEVESRLRQGGSSFVGIGIQMTRENNRAMIKRVLPGSPAEQGGLQDFDNIVAVNGVAVNANDLSDITSRLMGEAGTIVNVTVARGDGRFQAVITRGRIQQNNVQTQIINEFGLKLGMIKIATFMDRNLCTRVAEAIESFKKDDAQGLILDVRDNGGGLLDQGLCLGGLFVGKKTITKVRNLQTSRIEDLVSDKDQITDLPLVTLINGHSASASELIAGAFQDYRRSWLVGNRSFGKGSVQSGLPFHFPGLRNVQLYATTARFYQPSGRTNQAVGILPDFDIPEDTITPVEYRYVTREADLSANALEAEGPAWVQPRPQEVEQLAKCQKDTVKLDERWDAVKYLTPRKLDYQILTAAAVLKCAK